VLHDRNLDVVDAALDHVRDAAAAPDANLMPPILDAVHTYATVGEICRALADVFGRWVEEPVL